MIQKNKTKIIVSIATGLLVQFIVGGYQLYVRKTSYQLHAESPHPAWFALGWLVVTLSSRALYYWGCAMLAEARGYSSAVVVGTLFIGLFIGCFVPAIPMLVPLVVILSSPDKNRIHSRRRRSRS